MRPVETVEDSGASNECWGRLRVAHETAPGMVLVTPTEGLATTPTERPTS